MERSQSAFYPSKVEIDAWVASVWGLVSETECQAEVLDEDGFSHSLAVNHAGGEYRYVRFLPRGMDDFYGYWQPTFNAPAPLLVHVPGYGAEMSTHPDLVALGFHVLHVSPMGYATPSGPDESKKRNESWPVLPDTVTSSAERGYRLWLANCIMAVQWAASLPEVAAGRVSFFGTSQGGGGALLLGSLFRDRGVRCVAADLPFLTNYPLAAGRGAYAHATEGLEAVENEAAGWRALGFVDSLSHAFRLTTPTLLSAGGKDETCPPETIASLYAALPGTRSLTFFEDLPHRYSREFIPLASAWFRLYA